MEAILMALDQGTTSSRTLLINETGQVLTQAQKPLRCLYPNSGWVEQDPQEIWQSQLNSMQAVLSESGTLATSVSALGIANQRETLIAWNKETGETLYNAIVWQCRRTAKFCDELKSDGLEPLVRQKTGLVLDAYFSGTKMHWILENVPEARELAQEKKLAFGTVDSWLIYKLTGGREHITDVSNASRTLIYNIFESRWDEELLERFGIPEESLPRVVSSSGVIAMTDASITGAEIPIAGIAGDQQAALFGQACIRKGMAKNTYGTGCFLLMNTGNKPILSKSGLLTTIAWKIGDKTTYALEGSVFIAGALIQWLRDGLGILETAAQTEAMALSVADSGGVVVVPAFVGLGAPTWDPYARGTILGLTRDSNRNHIARASLEAIAFQSLDVLNAMESDLGAKLHELKVDGGACANNFLMQFQADLLGTTVSRPKIYETTALGAAFLAGLATGVFKSEESLAELWQEEQRFQPQVGPEKMEAQIQIWHRAIDRAKNWLQ
jgi:glycerol kinase